MAGKHPVPTIARRKEDIGLIVQVAPVPPDIGFGTHVEKIEIAHEIRRDMGRNIEVAEHGRHYQITFGNTGLGGRDLYQLL